MDPQPGTAPVWAEAQGRVPLSVPQAARALGISERAVRKRITAGSIPAKRDGRQWTVYIPAVPGGTESEPSDPRGTTAVPESGTRADAGGTSALEQVIESLEDVELSMSLEIAREELTMWQQYLERWDEFTGQP